MRQLHFVEENFENIPPWLEWDVELLGLAREYLSVREQFAAGSPLRSKMDAALKDYFSASQQVGDRSIVAAQMEILASSDALMHEFPIEQNELLGKFYAIWVWASHDVAERQSIAKDAEVNENIWASRAAVLLERLEKECNNSMTGVMWSGTLGLRLALLATLMVIIGVILAVFLGLTIEAMSSEEHGWIGGILGLTLSILLMAKLKPVLDQKLWAPLNEKFARECYAKLWRRELMDFQRRSHMPDRYFRAMFAHFANKSATASWVNAFVQQDYAPALLAGAQRYEA